MQVGASVASILKAEDATLKDMPPVINRVTIMKSNFLLCVVAELSYNLDYFLFPDPKTPFSKYHVLAFSFSFLV